MMAPNNCKFLALFSTVLGKDGAVFEMPLFSTALCCGCIESNVFGGELGVRRKGPLLVDGAIPVLGCGDAGTCTERGT